MSHKYKIKTSYAEKELKESIKTLLILKNSLTDRIVNAVQPKVADEKLLSAIRCGLDLINKAINEITPDKLVVSCFAEPESLEYAEHRIAYLTAELAELKEYRIYIMEQRSEGINSSFYAKILNNEAEIIYLKNWIAERSHRLNALDIIQEIQSLTMQKEALITDLKVLQNKIPQDNKPHILRYLAERIANGETISYPEYKGLKPGQVEKAISKERRTIQSAICKKKYRVGGIK